MKQSQNKKNKVVLFCFMLFLCFTFSIKKASATTYNVTTSSPCSLGEAIIASNNDLPTTNCPAGTTSDTINLAAGFYNIVSNVPTIDKDGNLTINGAGSTQTILDGGNAHFGINMNPPSHSNTYTVSNLTMQNFITTDLNGVVLAAFKGNFNANNLIVRENKCTGTPSLCALFLNVGGNNSNFNITNSSVYSNQADFIIGVGIILGGSGNITTNIINNTFSNNTGSVFLFEHEGVNNGSVNTANIINNTFANNATLGINATFAANRIEPYSPVWQAVLIKLKNNIFYNNTGDNASKVNCPTEKYTEHPSSYNVGPNAQIVSEGGNISDDTSCAEYFTSARDKNSTNPVLGVLTQSKNTYVMPILSNSPAYNNGILEGSPATDQRGVARPQSIRPDSGSYELEVVAPSPAPTPTPAAPNTSMIQQFIKTKWQVPLVIILFSVISILLAIFLKIKNKKPL